MNPEKNVFHKTVKQHNLITMFLEQQISMISEDHVPLNLIFFHSHTDLIDIFHKLQRLL